MAAPARRYGGLTLGGILVIVGLIVVVIWSFWIGLIIALIGLVAFGGFVRGPSVDSCAGSGISPFASPVA